MDNSYNLYTYNSHASTIQEAYFGQKKGTILAALIKLSKFSLNKSIKA